MIKPTKKRTRENKLLEELRTKHDYYIAQMDRKTERFTTIFKGKGVEMAYVPAIVVRLVVPMDSALGQAIGQTYLYGEKSKKPAPKKKKRVK